MMMTPRKTDGFCERENISLSEYYSIDCRTREPYNLLAEEDFKKPPVDRLKNDPPVNRFNNPTTMTLLVAVIITMVGWWNTGAVNLVELGKYTVTDYFIETSDNYCGSFLQYMNSVESGSNPEHPESCRRQNTFVAHQGWSNPGSGTCLGQTLASILHEVCLKINGLKGFKVSIDGKIIVSDVMSMAEGGKAKAVEVHYKLRYCMILLAYVYMVNKDAPIILSKDITFFLLDPNPKKYFQDAGRTNEADNFEENYRPDRLRKSCDGAHPEWAIHLIKEGLQHFSDNRLDDDTWNVIKGCSCPTSDIDLDSSIIKNSLFIQDNWKTMYEAVKDVGLEKRFNRGFQAEDRVQVVVKKDDQCGDFDAFIDATKAYADGEDSSAGLFLRCTQIAMIQHPGLSGTQRPVHNEDEGTIKGLGHSMRLWDVKNSGGAYTWVMKNSWGTTKDYVEYSEHEMREYAIFAYTYQSSSWILEEVRKDGPCLKYAHFEFRNDRKLMIRAVQIDGSALKFASCFLQGDREVVLAAVQQDGMALEFADSDSRQNEEIVLAAVRQNPMALRFAPLTLRNDPALQLVPNMIA